LDTEARAVSLVGRATWGWGLTTSSPRARLRTGGRQRPPSAQGAPGFGPG
jgi:hypothetical protein